MLRILVACVSLTVALQAAKAPITHETMWSLKRVGAPAPSPDGKWVVVPVTEPSYDAKLQVSDLWIVPSDGSAPPRRLTATRTSESSITWSADSKRIAFTAKRDGDEDAQVYILDIGGGEAQRVTQATGGASNPQFSPDGSQLLYQTEFDPIAAERKSRKYNARVFETFPIRHWDHWLTEKRPRLMVQSLPDAPAAPKDILAGTRLVAGRGFDGVMESSGSDLNATWSPDGGSIIFAATENRQEGAFAPVVTSIYRISVEGNAEAVRISDGQHSYSRPYFRPDGKALYALQDRNNDKVYSLSRVVKWSWPFSGADLVNVSAALDRSVNTFAVTPDNKTLYALAEEHGHEKLFRMPADGGPASLAFDMKLGTYLNLRIPPKAAEPLLIANWESAVNPQEVVRLDARAGLHKALTAFNDAAIANLDWQPLRHFWFTAANGRRIHNMIVLPPGFDETKKYPLVSFIHGGPHTMSRDQFHTRWNYHLLSAPGYVILTTNYTGSTGFGEAFAQAIQGDPLKGPGEELNQAVDEAIKQFPFIDGSRLAAGGASYGGHLANWLEATTTRYKCLFSHAGLINLESQWGTSDTIYHRELNNGGPVWEQGKVWREQNPIRFAAKFKTPILLTVGEQDFRVPLNQTIEHWSVLQRQQVPSKLIVFPDENHWILKGENNRFFFQQLHGWLAKHLGGAGKASD